MTAAGGDLDIGAGLIGGARRRTAPCQFPLLLRARVPDATLTILPSARLLVRVPSVAPAPASATSSATRGLDHVGAIFSASQISRDLGCDLILSASRRRG